jgi:2-keto-4-pentenoate hydratase/2-oxohepta-3-ene-1,7-dioic acid hydratase in catechol pathway
MTAFTLHLNGKPFPAPLGKIVCVGRNYAAHAAELNNPVPSAPLLFMKPASAAARLEQPLALPTGLGAVHHEMELCVLIGKPLTCADPRAASAAIAGIGLALDLTLRDVQDQLKKDGHPWERAKAFDGAYPMSEFIDAEGLDLNNLSIQLWRNGKLQQNGNTGQMLFAIDRLIAEISRNFSLLPGDIVSTGTPAGVGPLASGDVLIATLGKTAPADLLRVATTVI